VAQLVGRLGYPAVFNPCDPDGSYSFDLSLREHVIVAHAMVVLAYEEPGENVQNERLNGQAQAQIPSSWLQINGIPEEGAWELHYVTKPLCSYPIIPVK